jgi:alpha-tubulin suppressor-like RCC1 family protein
MYSSLFSLLFYSSAARKQINPGVYHTMFLTDTGDVYACGRGEYGQLGTGSRENQLTPTKINFPPGGDRIKEISTSNNFHSVFLSETGEVYACGSGRYGQLGTGTEEDQLTPVKINFPPDAGGLQAGPIKKISANNSHTIFLSEAGKVYACGYGEDGELGFGTIKSSLTPINVEFSSDASGPQTVKIKEIGDGGYHSTFLTITGEVYVCGSGEYGRLGTGNTNDQLTPIKINFPPGVTPIKQISASLFRTIFLSETGEVYSCGFGEYGELGLGDTSIHPSPTKVVFSPDTNIVSINDSENHTMFLTGTGEVFACGKGWSGQLGTGNEDDHFSPVKISPSTVPIKKVVLGDQYTIFINDKGEVYVCGLEIKGRLGTGEDHREYFDPVKLEFPPGSSPIKEVDCGFTYTVFLTETGNIYVCGSGEHGRLGTGDTLVRLKPTKIALNLSVMYP